MDGPAFDTLDGKNHKARFGLSVACAGNINLDGITSESPKGIQDLVIGAPYDGEDHRGAIYIYLGTPNGISQTHSQVLTRLFLGCLVVYYNFTLIGISQGGLYD